jgi:hypothetical protein
MQKIKISEVSMDKEFEEVNDLVDEIVGTANFISRVLFNREYVLAIAVVTLVVGILFVGI